MKSAAKSILASVKKMVPGYFEIERADQYTHPHVAWKAYESVRDRAEELGFRHLGYFDVVSSYQDAAMFKRAVVSAFVSADGTMVLAHYRLKPRWTLKGIMVRMFAPRGDLFDFGTHFNDASGVSVGTTTAQAISAWDHPDFLKVETMPYRTSLEEVMDRHRDRVQQYRSHFPYERPMVVRTLDDIVRLNNVTEKRKLEWRRARGWATRDELARLSKGNPQIVDQLYRAFCEVAAQTADAA